VPLPAEPTARGPLLFAASAVRAWQERQREIDT